MKLINVEQIVTMELFDEEHEEYYKKKISIEDMIATYTTEMELPTVDAVPVIRCKDCKHWDGYYCHHKGYGNGYANYSPPIKSGEGFCDWAERKEK